MYIHMYAYIHEDKLQEEMEIEIGVGIEMRIVSVVFGDAERSVLVHGCGMECE